MVNDPNPLPPAVLNWQAQVYAPPAPVMVPTIPPTYTPPPLPTHVPTPFPPQVPPPYPHAPLPRPAPSPNPTHIPIPNPSQASTSSPSYVSAPSPVPISSPLPTPVSASISAPIPIPTPAPYPPRAQMMPPRPRNPWDDAMAQLTAQVGQLRLDLLEAKNQRPPRYNGPPDLSHITCYTCHEKGHYATHCPLRNSPKPPTVSLIDAKNDPEEVVDVLLKRGRVDQDAGDEKKGKRRAKDKEAENSKTARRRKRHLGVQDFSLSHGQEPYSIMRDLGKQRAEITYGQLVALAPSIRRELRSSINTRRRAKEVITNLVGAEVDVYTPMVDVVCNGMHIKNVLIDGGAAVNVLSDEILDVLKLKVDHKAHVTLGMANKARERPEGVVVNVVVAVMGVSTALYFQVMKATKTSYPMLLGRPWLKRVHAREYWNEGFMTIGKAPYKQKIPIAPTSKAAISEEDDDSEVDNASASSGSESEVETEMETSEAEVNVHVLDVVPKVGPPSIRHSLSEDEINERLASVQFGDDLDNEEKEEFLCML